MSEQAEQIRRAVAYIRESTEEQGRGYSPDGQRQAIARYATDHGMRLAEEYLDFETGRLADKRPGFQRLIEDAMERRFEVVLVFHTSRFARNTVEAKRYKKLLRSELGIDVISVTQPLGANADDPAAFLSESVHEIFDEYYSVSLSFWTKMGLREKARQGKLTGSLPWGYVKGEDEIATPDPEKAPYVRRLFEMYATGQHSDRTLTAWLNVNEQRTTRGRPFGVDTVREMLCNAAYAGYVSGRRDNHQGDQGPARADSGRGPVRPGETDAPPARPQPEARAPLPALPPARAGTLPALPRQDAGHHRRPRADRPLLLRNAACRPLLRPVDRARRADRGPAHQVHYRVRADPRDPRGHPAPPRQRYRTREQRHRPPPLRA
jgi:DNA invertase Pin-like site-specific DNA recombinase